MSREENNTGASIESTNAWMETEMTGTQDRNLVHAEYRRNKNKSERGYNSRAAENGDFFRKVDSGYRLGKHKSKAKKIAETKDFQTALNKDMKIIDSKSLHSLSSTVPTKENPEVQHKYYVKCNHHTDSFLYPTLLSIPEKSSLCSIFRSLAINLQSTSQLCPSLNKSSIFNYFS